MYFVFPQQQKPKKHKRLTGLNLDDEDQFYVNTV